MTRPDSAMGARDINLYKEIGKIGTEITGYPTISIYEEFTPDKTKARRGGLMDWTYEELGITSFGTELWDLERTAGVDKVDYLNLYPRTEEIQHKIYTYINANVGERGWRPWTPFDHPQLGAVEIGGMVNIWSYRNPPEALLEDICRRNVLFNLRHATASPKLKIDEVIVTEIGESLYKIRAIASNHGYLPTNLSDVAIANGVAKPVLLSLTIEGGDLVMNPATADLGNLAGRNERLYPWSPWGQQWTATTKAVEWLVKILKKGSITVTATSEKAGVDRITRQIE